MIIIPLSKSSYRNIAPFWNKSLADIRPQGLNYFVIFEADDIEIWVETNIGIQKYLYKFDENIVSELDFIRGVHMNEYFLYLLEYCKLPQKFFAAFETVLAFSPNSLMALADSFEAPATGHIKAMIDLIKLLDNHSRRIGPIELVDHEGEIHKAYFEEISCSFRRIQMEGRSITLEHFYGMFSLSKYYAQK